ncbi:MAG: N-acetylmuramoyl-L-alanine amidase [Desulfuromonadaceae bacterium]|nr:N-acetylmuramoyl-L-alanine amidase [Desulfuromonadaceae bacterium]
MRFLCSMLFILICFAAVEANAEVELSRQGHRPHLIKEVYNVDGAAYLALDDLLPAIGLSGYWHSTQHLYFINLPQGQASLYPGGPYMKYGQRYVMLDRPARFIDGRLRVAEQVVLNQLADQLPYNIYYRNLKGITHNIDEVPTDQDQFFSFLLHKQFSTNRQNLRGIMIDPAHGGDDVGVMGLKGIKEKDVVLDVALDLRRHIKMQLGIPVHLTRNEDYTLQDSERLQVARENSVDLLLLLHAQAGLSAEQEGIHLYVRTNEDMDSFASFSQGSSMALALRLRSALREAGFKVHEVSSTTLLPLPRSEIPIVLVELGYLSNAHDVENLTDAVQRQSLAAALLKGVQDFHQNLETM